MTAEPSFRPFFSFRDAPPAATRRWCDAFMYLLRKLTIRAAGRRLLLKSPCHTGRVALLRRLFPGAQFVYIHRHPETVYQSACHMADTTYWYMYLATPTDAQVHDFILNQFEVLWDEYDADRKALPASDLAEVSFEQLDNDPVGTLRSIYAQLGLGAYEGSPARGADAFDARVKPRVEAATSGRPSKYQKNAHKPLPAALRKIVAGRWEAYSRAWGYTWD